MKADKIIMKQGRLQFTKLEHFLIDEDKSKGTYRVYVVDKEGKQVVLLTTVDKKQALSMVKTLVNHLNTLTKNTGVIFASNLKVKVNK